MKKILFIMTLFFTVVLLKPSYSLSGSSGYLYFRGFKNKEVLLFKVTSDPNGFQKKTPLLRLSTNSKVLLPKGKYVLANECSFYEFDHGDKNDSPTVIYLSHLQLKFSGRLPTKEELIEKNQIINSRCYNLFESKQTASENQDEFDILPGKNNIFISGKNFLFDLKPQEFKDFTLDLSSVSLSSSFENQFHPFFATPIIDSADKNKKISDNNHVLSAPVNGKIWLYPGKYKFEVNGTTRDIELKNNEEQSIVLGSLKIVSPKNFPFEKRLQSGVQPIFVNINTDVLYQLDTDYVVFPGEYTLNFNNSKISKKVVVLENQESVIKTYGAQIDSPACPADVPVCRVSPNITIHVDKEAFDSMIIPAGVPFLVFDGNYQYGVEGVRGILKNLIVSSDSTNIQKLGHVKLNWHKTPASGKQRTNFVRFESHGGGLSGKSLDLLFSKPNDIYLPEGSYLLTYYTSDLSSGSSPKVRQEVSLVDKGTQELTVPLYVQGVVNEPKEVEVPNADDKPVLTPIAK